MSRPELPEIPEVTIELLPHEREALLKWIYTPDVRDQLEALDSPTDVASITLSRTLVGWVASDLTHAIVKKGCRDDDVIDLSERFDYINDTSDGSLRSWWD